MTTLLPIVVVCYGLVVVTIHIARFLLRKRPAPAPVHYVLMGDNEGLQMEWYIRSIRWMSWWSGKPVKITVMQEAAASTGESLSIVRKLARDMSPLELYSLHARDASLLTQPDREERLLQLLMEKGVVTAAEPVVLIDLRERDARSRICLQGEM